LSSDNGESFFDQPVLEPVSLLPGVTVIFDNQTDVFFHDGDRGPAQFLVSVQQMDLSFTVIHGFGGQGKFKIGRQEYGLQGRIVRNAVDINCSGSYTFLVGP
jgi:hypothetical protein